MILWFCCWSAAWCSKSLHLPVPQFLHLQNFGMCFELLCWAYASLRSSAAAVGFWKLLGRAAWCEVALGLGRWHQFSSAAVSQLAL